MQNRKIVRERARLNWVGVLFGVALNLLLVTLADYLVLQLAPTTGLSVTVRLVAPLLAGLLTALYGEERYARLFGWPDQHSAVGALCSKLGAWQLSLLAGVLCALAGAVTEVARRGGAEGAR
ncbi:MAG: hypothetical protein R2867_45885 [Caldilineaceae bacterium]